MKRDIEAIRAACQEVGDCWEWQGACDHKAPTMRLDGTRRAVAPVRRVILDLQGKLKPSLFAVAGCGNHRCVNPDHIRQLTRSQLQSRTAKEWNLAANPARSAKISAARRAAGVKLTQEFVDEMRAQGMTSRAAAKQYGVAQSTALQALRGDTWKDYTNPFAALMG